VLKAVGRDILHKSEAGLVVVGLRSAAQVRTAYQEILERAPGADGVLVCEQVSGGVETVVGVSQDDLFGPVVMVGLGGIFVEVLGDVSFRVPPFTKADAAAMVGELKSVAVLRGVRGRPKADVTALVDTLMKVQRMAVDLAGEMAELDINPLLVQPRGAVALDALIVTR
jgi:acyl-CoA synthetase (NDP forming)